MEEETKPVTPIMEKFKDIPAEAITKAKTQLLENLHTAAYQKEVDAGYVLTWIPEQEGIAAKNKAAIDLLDQDIKNIQDGPDNHKRENRDMVKFKEQEIERLQAEIKAAEASIANYKQQSEASLKTADELKKKVIFVNSL